MPVIADAAPYVSVVTLGAFDIPLSAIRLTVSNRQSVVTLSTLNVSLLALHQPVLPILSGRSPLRLLCPARITLHTLLLSAVLSLDAHLLPAVIAFRTLLLAAVLNAPCLALLALPLARLLGRPLPTGIHLVHPLLPTCIILLSLLATCIILPALLPHYLLTLLTAVGAGLLRALPLDAVPTASSILTLRRSRLTGLSASAAITAFLTLNLPLLSLLTSAATLSGLSSASAVSTAAAFTLPEGICLRTDKDRERGERGKKYFI